MEEMIVIKTRDYLLRSTESQCKFPYSLEIDGFDIWLTIYL